MKSARRKSACLSRLALVLLAVAGLVGLATPAQAAVFNTCAQYGEYTEGAWTIYNNVWGNNTPNT